MAIRLFSFVILSLFNFSLLFGQSFVRGKEFYLAFPSLAEHVTINTSDIELTINPRNIETYPFNLIIRNGDEVLLNETFTSQFNIPRYFEFPKEYIIQLPSESVLDYGIHISASSNVTITAQFNRRDFVMETSKILPLKSLGTEYLITSSPGVQTMNEAGTLFNYKGQLTVVATEDNTEIEIIPNFESENGNPKDNPVKITLNEGQMYEMRPVFVETDITGTIVKSCAPIAVFGGATGVYNPSHITTSCCVDPLWEQMIPVENWGEKFYTIPPLSPRTDVLNLYSIKALAAKDSTAVYVNGELKATLNTGEYYTQDSIDDPIVVESNNPIQLAEFLYSGYLLGEPLNPNLFQSRLGDPAMVLLQPIKAKTNQYNASPITSDPFNLAGYYMTAIILKEEDISDLNIDLNNNYTFFPYSYDPTYVCAIGNTWGYFESIRKFQIYEYFLGDAVSYFHTGTYSYPLELPETPEIILPDEICINENIEAQLNTTVASRLYEYEWDFGNGDIANDNPTSYTYSESGEYEINITIRYEDCEEYEFSKTIRVVGNSSPDFEIEGDSTSVLFDTLLYSVPVAENSIVEWNIEGGQIVNQSLNTATVTWDMDVENSSITATEITAEACVGATDILNVKILDVQIEEGKCFGDLTIAPNPVSEMLNFSTLMIDDKEFTFRIFNSIGQLTDAQTKGLTRGNTDISFDVHDYPSGVYFLNIDNGDCRETVKWVKMR